MERRTIEEVWMDRMREQAPEIEASELRFFAELRRRKRDGEIMRDQEVIVGRDYLFASGIVRRVIEIDRSQAPRYTRIWLENINGKQPGHRQWESMDYFRDAAIPHEIS